MVRARISSLICVPSISVVVPKKGGKFRNLRSSAVLAESRRVEEDCELSDVEYVDGSGCENIIGRVVVWLSHDCPEVDCSVSYVDDVNTSLRSDVQCSGGAVGYATRQA